ncbi:hypothetical protein Tco_0877165 [Tanacetum coccineum]|uniref:Secreted protein n=1 Tax=Tanacetum coccineum TaxID=301880 RepID=A0ABQ5C043_9ASTR
MACTLSFFCFPAMRPNSGFITTVVVFKCHDTRALGAPEQAQQQLMWPCLNAIASTKAAAYGGGRHALGARLRLCPLAKYDRALVRANKHNGFAFYGVRDAPTASKWLAMVRLVYLVMLIVQAEVTTQDFLQ